MVRVSCSSIAHILLTSCDITRFVILSIRSIGYRRLHRCLSTCSSAPTEGSTTSQDVVCYNTQNIHVHSSHLIPLSSPETRLHSSLVKHAGDQHQASSRLPSSAWRAHDSPHALCSPISVPQQVRRCGTSVTEPPSGRARSQDHLESCWRAVLSTKL